VNGSVEALARLAADRFDVVVLDVKMPGMDGIEALREMKKRHPLVEVILLTGHADVDVAIEGMEIGAFDFLVKPAEIDDLLYKIQDAYERKTIQEAKIRNLERERGSES
jgi:DNA-binding NtrC family response regulator